jgi:hypothetical protein
MASIVLRSQPRVLGMLLDSAVIDSQGNVVDMKVVSGPPLYSAAMKALGQWKFEPMPSLCTLAPVSRRPTSGSVLSLAVLCRHVALRDYGKPVGCFHPVPSPTTLAFDFLVKSRHFQHPPPSDSRGGVPFRGLPTVRFRLQPADLLAPLSERTRLSPSPRGLLLPGFRRIGHPHRRRI